MSALIYKPGQQVWLVLSLNRPTAYATTIEKVGRKWATLDHGRFRFDLTSGYLDGGERSSPGRVYESREVYEMKLATDVAWRNLHSDMGSGWYRAREGVTLERIQQARVLLGLESKP